MRTFFSGFLIGLLTLGGLSCGAPPEAGKTGGGSPKKLPVDFGMLRLSDGVPGLHVSALYCEGDDIEAEFEVPAGGGELQFSPWCLSDEAAGYEVRVGSTLAHSGNATIIPGDLPQTDAILSRIVPAVRLNMNAHAGEHVRIRWRPKNVNRASDFVIANARLVPRSRNQVLPPVLIICSDTHRADFATEGRGPVLMPRLTAFAGKAVVYDNAFSPASWTFPAMVSFFTGVWPLYHGSGGLASAKSGLENAAPYNPEFFTLQEHLRELGYVTCMLHSNPYLYFTGMFADGFDHAVGVGFGSGEEIARIAEVVIQALPAEQPPYLYVHLMDLHDYKSKQFRQMYPGIVPEYSDRARAEAAYAKAVASVDDAFGRIVDAWERKYGAGNSIIVFTSDHGEHLFDPGHPPITEEEFRELGVPLHLYLPLLSHGSSMEDWLLRIPLVVRYPDSTGVPHERIKASVSLIDLYPTIAGLTGGMKTDLPHHGIPLLPAPDPDAAAERIFHADLQPYGDMLSSIRRGHFKLVINHSKGESTLYDLRKVDGTAGEPGAVVLNEAVSESLDQIFRQYESQARAFGLSRKPGTNPSEEMARDLKRLGYIK